MGCYSVNLVGCTWPSATQPPVTNNMHQAHAWFELEKTLKARHQAIENAMEASRRSLVACYDDLQSYIAYIAKTKLLQFDSKRAEILKQIDAEETSVFVQAYQHVATEGGSPIDTDKSLAGFKAIPIVDGHNTHFAEFFRTIAWKSWCQFELPFDMCDLASATFLSNQYLKLRAWKPERIMDLCNSGSRKALNMFQECFCNAKVDEAVHDLKRCVDDYAAQMERDSCYNSCNKHLEFFLKELMTSQKSEENVSMPFFGRPEAYKYFSPRGNDKKFAVSWDDTLLSMACAKTNTVTVFALPDLHVGGVLQHSLEFGSLRAPGQQCFLRENNAIVVADSENQRLLEFVVKSTCHKFATYEPSRSIGHHVFKAPVYTVCCDSQVIVSACGMKIFVFDIGTGDVMKTYIQWNRITDICILASGAIITADSSGELCETGIDRNELCPRILYLNEFQRMEAGSVSAVTVTALPDGRLALGDQNLSHILVLSNWTDLENSSVWKVASDAGFADQYHRLQWRFPMCVRTSSSRVYGLFRKFLPGDLADDVLITFK